MNYDRSGGPDLLPARLDTAALGEEARALFARAAESLPTAQRRTLYWSLRLMQEREAVRRAAAAVRGRLFVAFGFLDPEYEADDFGVIVFARPEGDGRDEPGALGALRLDERAFPVVVRRAALEPHAAPAVPQPSLGSAGVWARSRLSGTPVGPGVLTAKHVLAAVGASGLGARIVMSCGCLGSVADLAPPCIDVALITCTCSPSGPARLGARMLVAPSTAVEFHGNATGATIATTVTATSDVLRIYSDPEIPVTVVLAQHGLRGDSGALVIETAGPSLPAPHAVGLYLGRYVNGQGTVGGFAQHAGQACTLMDMELLT